MKSTQSRCKLAISGIVSITPLLFCLGCATQRPIPTSQGLVDANDVQLYYKTVGQGPPIVILHGGPGFDHHHMLPFAELAGEHTVVFYDQRTTGDSTGQADPNSITIDNFVEDLETLRRELNLGKINLIGHSWGSLLAMYYGIKHPDNLSSLTLLSPYASSEIFGEYSTNLQARMQEVDRYDMGQIENSDGFKDRETEIVQEYYRASVRPMFHDRSKADKLDMTFGKNTANNQAFVAVLLMANLGEFDIHEQLPVIKCPTLIMHGDDDPLPVEAAYKVHKQIPESKFIVLKNSGHFIFIESQREVLSAIERFLRDPSSVETSIPRDIQARLNSASP